MSDYHYHPENRKTYSDSHAHYITCPHDHLGSFASILGSAAKIIFSIAVLSFLKVFVGKMMLIPLTFILLAKMGLKAVLLWPMISKIVKYFKKKKKKSKGRSAVDCSERIACVMQRAVKSGWSGHLGAAAAFTLIGDDVDEDSPLAKILLAILAGDEVAKCMSLECTSGVDVS